MSRFKESSFARRTADKIFAALIFFGASASRADETKVVDQGLEQLSWYIEKIWRFSVFSIDGNAVEVSQIVIALLMFIIGVLLSLLLTRRIKKQLLSAKRVDENSVAVLDRILFYTLIFIVVISSLQMVQIPITMFAFLGGAIAIGIGFGAQNIFNNFISGLILMFERPVRLSDVIEIDGFAGKVIRIGSRCTWIKRADGIEMLIPNSKLLENNLVNRTLSDKVIRRELTVGVAYGSPAAEVAEILSNVAEAHPEILIEPPHQIRFDDFGDNALIFVVLYWVELKDMGDMRRIGSELRFSIDEKFQEAGITIAYPQRDIHLDTNRFEVKILPAKEITDGDAADVNQLS
ncbi:mechanosensitive ion channel family protein [Gemmatimonadota bacterium]